MLKKTITYTDFNGDEVSEDFFFHLSKAELITLELSHKGGMSEALKKIIEAEDGKTLIEEFRNILLNSYGIRSEDGKRFIKNQELRDEFESTEAYSTIFMELLLNTDFAIEFVNGVIPKNMEEELAKVVRVDLKAVKDENEKKSEPILVTRDELIEMNSTELEALAPKLNSGEVQIVTTRE